MPRSATQKEKGFDKSVVQTLLLLPLGVTAVIVVLQHSLAYLVRLDSDTPAESLVQTVIDQGVPSVLSATLS